MATSNLNVTIGEKVVISQCHPRRHHWYPTMLFRLNDGGVVLGFSLCPDTAGNPADLAEGEPHCLLKSIDDGTNWILLGTNYGGFSGESPRYQLSDGTLMGMTGAYMKDSGELYVLQMLSQDGINWDEPQIVPVRLPEGVLRLSEEGPIRTRRYVFPHGGLIESADGSSLLLQVTTKFEGDECWRLCLLRYTEASGCWDYVTTIGDPQKWRTHFSEADLIRLPDGVLLSVIRTGGGQPMYQAKSMDDGESWELQRMTACGVKPKLCLLTNGVVACSSGRLAPRRPGIGDQVLFSEDGGRTWSDPTRIFHGPSTGYTGLLEIRPNEVCSTSTTNRPSDGWNRASIASWVSVSGWRSDVRTPAAAPDGSAHRAIEGVIVI